MGDRTTGRRTAISDRVDRRSVLAAGGATIALLAGCTDEGPGDGNASPADPDPADENDDGEATTDDESADGGENASENGDDESEASDANEADEGDEAATDEDDAVDDEDESALDHPAAANTAHSPVLGPAPAEAPATIVMFDDPSCPACAYFEDEIFPDLEPHIEAGELSVIWRGVPVIEDWSDASLQVLWAAYERDVDAFWAVREHLFASQDSIDGGEAAIEEAAAYLETETSLDADAIRSEAESGEFSARIERDTDAAVDAGLDATPYFYLFRDGEFRTEIRGAEDYRVFESALEL